MLVVAEQEATRRFLHEQAAYVHPPSFVDGAEWYAAGMAVCAFLEDLARLHAEQRGPTRACAECGVLRCNHCTGACSLDVCCGGFREVAP